MSTWTSEARELSYDDRRPVCRDVKSPKAVLSEAIALLDSGRPEAADEALTMALIHAPDDADLWLAAGVARLRRGALAPSRTAFQMCAWLSDDTLAREMVGLL